MTKPPDLETLARQYLELWQSQLTAMAADPETAAALGRMLDAMAKAHPAAGAAGPMGAMGPFGAMGAPGPFGPQAWAGNPAAAMAQTMWPGAGGGSGAGVHGAGPEGGPDDGESEQTGSGDQVGAATSAAAPGHGDDAVAGLERRVAELEKRLDRLERGASGRGAGAQRGGGKR